MTKLYKKNWIFDLICLVLGIVIAVLLFIPSISEKIIAVAVGILLLTFFVTVLCPKFKKIKSFGAEWVIWFLIEATLVLALGILAIISRSISIKFLFFNLQLNHIIGLVICIEGVIGIVRLVNYRQTTNQKSFYSEKYCSIIAIVLGTYIFASVSITNQDLAIILGVLAIIFAIVSGMYMTANLPEKDEVYRKKKAEQKKQKIANKEAKDKAKKAKKEEQARKKSEKEKIKNIKKNK